MRILAGLDEPTSGAVLLDGHEVRGPGRDRGMVFQGYTLFPWLTVNKNVMFGLRGRRDSRACRRRTQARSGSSSSGCRASPTPIRTSSPAA